MKFEWDAKKVALNERKHGVSFHEALTVFQNDSAQIIDDPDHSLAEQREIIIGTSQTGRTLFTSFTRRIDSIRIISSRPASRIERKDYEDYKATLQ